MKFLAVLLLCSTCLSVIAFNMDKLEPQTIKGTRNNLDKRQWGKADSFLLRKDGIHYDDGLSIPRGGFDSSLPSPRYVSNTLAATIDGDNKIKSRYGSDLLAFFGQWLAHEIVVVETNDPCEEYNIPIPTQDLPFNPTNDEHLTLPFCRARSKDVDGVRQQLNSVTSWIDGSNVYSSDDKRLRLLRDKSGKMAVSFPLGKKGGEYFPRNIRNKKPMLHMANAAGRVDDTYLFAAGDIRANENVVLMSFHLLFLREHNRIVDSLPNKYSGNQKFEIARKYVIAYIQHTIFAEYMPMIRGKKFPEYTGYDPSLSPGIETSFTVAALRFGHSMIPSVLERFNEDWEESKAGHLLLRDGFFWPDSLTAGTVESIWRGLTVTKPSRVDGKIVDDLRSHLFGQHTNPHHGGVANDLFAINIQRGRDHGLGSYNDVRRAYGLEPCEDMDCITNDPESLRNLRRVYGDDVESVDVYIGGLLEQHSSTTVLGDLFDRIIEDQMIRLREGDRFYFENDPFWTAKEIKEIKKTTLSDLIVRNSNGKIDWLPKNVFKLHSVREIQEQRRRNRDNNGDGNNDTTDGEDGEQCVEHTTINLNFGELLSN